MAHVVTAPCFGCKHTDCIVVCPCECFYEGEQMLYINPGDCIDCYQCSAECPVEAIYQEDDVPEQWQSFIQLNAEMWDKCSSITEKQEPLVNSTSKNQ